MFAEKSQLYDSNSGEISSGTDPTFDGFCGTLLVSDPSKRPGIAWLLAPILALGCLGFSMVRMRQRAPWFALGDGHQSGKGSIWIDVAMMFA